MCEAEKRQRFGDSKSGADAGRAGPADEDVGVLCKF